MPNLDAADAQRGAVLETALKALRALAPEELESLREAAKALARAISRAHQETLVAVGLGRYTLGGFMLTDLGKVAAEITRDHPSLI